MLKRILVPVEVWDASTSIQVLASAAMIARASGASIVALTVLPDSEAIQRYKFTTQTFDQAVAVVKGELEGLVRRHIPAEIPWRAAVIRGDIYRKILEAAEEEQADLIVMAAHSHHLGDFLIGSNAERVTRHARCSVYLVRRHLLSVAST